MHDPSLLPAPLSERIIRIPFMTCWLFDARWNSGKGTGRGYSKVSWEGRTWMAHRLVYTLLVDTIPENCVLDHRCSNRACCRPAHLEPVSQRVNVERGRAVLFRRVLSATDGLTGDSVLIVGNRAKINGVDVSEEEGLRAFEEIMG